MKIRLMRYMAVVVFASCIFSSRLWAEEDQNKAVSGAVAGASTQVLTSTALDYATNSSGQPEDPNKTILKRAIVGAVTGATAAGMTADQSSAGSTSVAAQTQVTSEVEKSAKAAKKTKSKHKWKFWEGFRPPGWDRGKKTGWDGGDVPPGLAKKSGHSYGEDQEDPREHTKHGGKKGKGKGH